MTRSTKSAQSTLLNRACNLPSTADEKSKEVKHVSDVLKANGYPHSIISNILKKERAMETILSQEELVGMFFMWVAPSETSFDLACLPYINGLTEPLRKIEFELSPDPTQPYNRNSLRQNSGRPATFNKFGLQNSLQCYIRETGRCLQTRRNNGSNVANHAWMNDARVIDKGDYRSG